MHGVGLAKLPRNLIQLAKGYFAARRILREFKPDVILYTGGYVAVPMALAARNRKSLVYIPDIEPGLALKFIQQMAKIIGVSVEDTLQYTPRSKRVVVTGYPVRQNVQTWTRESAREHFALDDSLPVILIFGGSKGARSINQTVLNNLEALAEKAQILHISGEANWDSVSNAPLSLPEDLRQNYHPFPYLHEDMGAALAAADLVVSRSGASTLGEYPQFGIPAILVPYPFAWKYQRQNAEFLRDAGGAVILENAELDSKLLSTISSLIDDSGKLSSMASSMKKLAKPSAANHLADLLRQLAGSPRPEL